MEPVQRPDLLVGSFSVSDALSTARSCPDGGSPAPSPAPRAHIPRAQGWVHGHKNKSQRCRGVGRGLDAGESRWRSLAGTEFHKRGAADQAVRGEQRSPGRGGQEQGHRVGSGCAGEARGARVRRLPVRSPALSQSNCESPSLWDSRTLELQARTGSYKRRLDRPLGVASLASHTGGELATRRVSGQAESMARCDRAGLVPAGRGSEGASAQTAPLQRPVLATAPPPGSPGAFRWRQNDGGTVSRAFPPPGRVTDVSPRM